MNLKAIIDRIEDNKVVLRLEDQQEIIINIEIIDFEIKEGDVIYFSLSKSEKETKDAKNITKNILKEILSKENDENKEKS